MAGGPKEERVTGGGRGPGDASPTGGWRGTGSRAGALLLLLWVGTAAPACTYRAWYEGLRERQRQECHRSQSEAEIQRCLEKVDRATYDEYRRARGEPGPGTE